jgi:hypothetical protein
MSELASSTAAPPNGFVDDSLRPTMRGNEWSIDQISCGIAIFKGQTKMAVANLDHRLGRYDDGSAMLQRMPRSSWRIHLTSPIQSPEDLEGILASLPKG